MQKQKAKNTTDYWGYLNLGNRGCGYGVYTVRSLGYKHVYVKKKHTGDQFTKLKRSFWDQHNMITLEEQAYRDKVRNWFLSSGRSLYVKCFRKDHPRGLKQRFMTWDEMHSIYCEATA